MEERQRKIAVAGTVGFEYSSAEVRVDCFPWDRIRKVGNLADYDFVVVDLLSVKDSDELDGDALEGVFSVRAAYEVLGGSSEGAIYVLGDPRHIVSVEALMDRPRRAGQPFLSWTGMEFLWDDRPGDTVVREPDAEVEPVKALVDNLGRWEYSLASCGAMPDQFEGVFDLDVLRKQDLRLAVQVEPLCATRYGNPLIFSVRLSAADLEYGHPGNQTIYRETLSGPIVFLPKLRLSERETVELVLRDLCGVDVSAPEPDWISEFVAPGQVEVEREIAELDGRIRGLIDEHDKKVEERHAVREPLRLLYETGTALEEAVWSVLEALGAEVERPEDRTKEDGWIAVRIGDETFEGVLEIKGVGGRHFGLGGLRQLTDWIERGMSLPKKKYHGVFVGNSAIREPPRTRIWPFNNNWVEQAKMRGYAAVRTEDLYVLYLLDKTGRLPDRDEFWRALFGAEGPLDMRPYRGRLSDEEREQLDNAPGP